MRSPREARVDGTRTRQIGASRFSSALAESEEYCTCPPLPVPLLVHDWHQCNPERGPRPCSPSYPGEPAPVSSFLRARHHVCLVAALSHPPALAHSLAGSKASPNLARLKQRKIISQYLRKTTSSTRSHSHLSLLSAHAAKPFASLHLAPYAPRNMTVFMHTRRHSPKRSRSSALTVDGPRIARRSTGRKTRSTKSTVRDSGK